MIFFHLLSFDGSFLFNPFYIQTLSTCHANCHRAIYCTDLQRKNLRQNTLGTKLRCTHLSMTWRWWCARPTSPCSPASTIRLMSRDIRTKLCSYRAPKLTLTVFVSGHCRVALCYPETSVSTKLTFSC